MGCQVDFTAPARMQKPFEHDLASPIQPYSFEHKACADAADQSGDRLQAQGPTGQCNRLPMRGRLLEHTCIYI